MNDLEWLARNVHEWPKTDSYAVVWHEKGRVRVLWDCGTQNGESFTRDQWLAERARLQNKPSWDDVPTQYSWYGQNASGKWDCFEYEPFANEHVNCWDYESGDALGLPNVGEVLGDWRDTLEPRPEEQTMTKKEWKQDELPPIGEECEVYRNGEWELCEIIAHIEQPMGTIAVFSYGREPGYGISGVDCLIPRYFRPVDVSRAEKARAVEDMYRDATGDDLCGDEMDDQDVVSLCQILYKAGYRKQEIKP